MPTLTVSNESTNNLETAVGGAIATNDAVYLDRGSADLTAGVNHAAKNVLSFTVGRGFLGAKIGGEGASVSFDCSNATPRTVLFAPGGRTCDFYCSGGSTGTWDKLEIDPAGPDGRVYFSAGTIETLLQHLGHFEARDTADVNNVYAFGGSVLLKPSTSVTALVEIGSGAMVVAQRQITAAKVGSGARLTIERPDPALTAPNAGTVEVWGGAALTLAHGNVTTLHLRPGAVLDLSRVSSPLTISTLHTHRGATITKPPLEGLVTVTTTVKYGQNAPTV